MSSETNPPAASDARPIARAVTASLLARYDRPGPRYTSYPTAVEFGPEVDDERYKQLLKKAATRPDDPLSLYVHLPFCEARCLFCGCHVIITKHYERTLPYLELLRAEIDMVSDQLGERRSIAQLHFGGGTPTYYRPEDLDALLEHLFARFERTANAELAVEVDPRVTTAAHLQVLASHGFNRISLGVQDLTPRVQEAIARVQSLEQTAGIVETARGLGFRGINVDLIYGLPFQTLDTFEQAVDQIIDLGVDRTAVYSFAYVPWIRGHQTQIPEAALPSAELKFELFAMARERFLSAGYEPIGIDHFALPHDELSVAKSEHRLRRNFQGYTVIPAPDVIGLGISAIGDVGGAYVQNVKKLSEYEDRIGAGRLPVERGVVRSEDDEVRCNVIHELMCNFRVDIAAIEARHSIVFAEYFAPDLEQLHGHEKEGMVAVFDDRIEATAVGELFIRNLALCFDRYWREKRQGETNVFSRTV